MTTIKMVVNSVDLYVISSAINSESGQFGMPDRILDHARSYKYRAYGSCHPLCEAW